MGNVLPFRSRKAEFERVMDPEAGARQDLVALANHIAAEHPNIKGRDRSPYQLWSVHDGDHIGHHEHEHRGEYDSIPEHL